MIRAVSVDDLIWADARLARPLALRCPVCGHGGPHAQVAEIPSLAPPHHVLSLIRCAGCASGFYDPPGIADFSDLNQDRDDFWRFYVEVGGGVWETIWPVLAAVAPGTRTLLDVGCGFGFLVDFWQRQIGAEAVGVELADYGAIGARMLGIEVHREKVEDCAALAGRRFDVVYASEVIEHVPDPAAFVALLAPFVADDGVLVLTTPAMDYVTPANASPTLLAALAPGFHGFLLSKDAFAASARDAGFAHVDVRVFGERQMLWASRKPRRIDVAPESMRPPYFSYLDKWYQQPDRASPLWQGYAYRYVRDLVNLGRVAEGSEKANALLAALEAAYGRDIADPAAMATRIRGCTTVVEFGRAAPFFLPSLYFALGAIAQNHRHDTEAARRYFRGALELGIDCARFGAIFFLEASSLIWPARMADAGIALATGDVDAAAAAFARLARHGAQCNAADGYAHASADYIEEAVPRGCEGLALKGAWGPAREVFAAYRDYLAAAFPGRDFTARATVEEVLSAEGATGWPRDPVFPFFFQGLLDSTAPDASTASHERLKALGELAGAHRQHPAYGGRLATFAEIARRYLPVPRPTPLFDFSINLGAARSGKR